MLLIEQMVCALKKGTQLNSGCARLWIVSRYLSASCADTCGYCVRLWLGVEFKNPPEKVKLTNLDNKDVGR
jgi:hypothetical protein